MTKNYLNCGAAVGAIMFIATGGAIAADIDPVIEPVVAPDRNFYVSIFGGANISVGNRDFRNGLTDGAGLPAEVDVDLETGFQAGGAIGYKWRNFSYGPITPRTELEVAYFDNAVDTINFSLNGPGNETVLGNSDVSGVNILGNLYLDFDNIFDSGLTPYIVGGLGISIVDLNINYNGAALNLRDTDEALLWSIGAGASYDITERASLFIDARFQQARNVGSLRRIGGAAVAGAGGGVFEDDINSVFVRGGLSYSF